MLVASATKENDHAVRRVFHSDRTQATILE